MYNSLIESKSKSAKILDDIFFEMVRQTNIDLFIEAGAFDGQTSLTVNSLKDCRIVALEANPYNFNQFKSNFLNTKIEYLNLAAGNEDKILTFFIQTEINGKEVTTVKKIIR